MDDLARSNRMLARLVLALLTLATTAVAGCMFFRVVASRGATTLGTFALVALFGVLFVWIAFSFWMATVGLVRRLRAGRAADCGSQQTPLPARITTRCAILMPVYNESPHGVFAGLRAIHESLQATGEGAAFDFFVLSDTTDPDVWLAEELSWARLTRVLPGDSRLFYRHRTRNEGRKSGNIADFCQRFGAAYEFMIVLDADSVMSGETIVELVRRMQQDPEIGILQTPPVPVNRGSLFARCQQFAAAVYGPIFLAGFAWWAGDEGNYWGHNAIIRLEAFTKACGLPRLPGNGPLGGEILSHDFVEAALIRRAGFKVCLAGDLDGSYEECPPTLLDFAQRDQRWCQGNLQHLRLIFSAGIHPVSRFHLSMGAMSYLSSPLWLLSLVLSFFVVALHRAPSPNSSAAGDPSAAGDWGLALFAGTMALLLLPKLWAYLVLLREPTRLAQCGGAAKAALSTLVETVVSMLVAPILMVFHSTFVVGTLVGRSVQWNAQQRNEGGLEFTAAVAAHWKQTLLAVLASVIVWTFAAAMLVWLIPVLAGLILAVPLSIVLSSVPLGRWLAFRGLLLIPQETQVPKVLRRQRHFLSLSPGRELCDARGIFRRVLTDPALLALHLSILSATQTQAAASQRTIRQTERQLLAGGPIRVSTENRKAVLADPAALEALHLFVWSTPLAPDKA
ncbi:MAG TPA: glucans biosynthesis glucosyltransferase MdoH [Pirellulales bacterium]|nr:glucans biosynthesis glucosyltransferase MdoH [Pirellulales bacterium]